MLVNLEEIGCRVCTNQPSLKDLVVELCRRQIEMCMHIVLHWRVKVAM